MLSFELDKNLRAIVGEGSLQDIVFKLIQTATSQGWVEDLVRAARNSNPGNPLLKAIAEGLLPNHNPETHNVPLPNIPSATLHSNSAANNIDFGSHSPRSAFRLKRLGKLSQLYDEPLIEIYLKLKLELLYALKIFVGLLQKNVLKLCISVDMVWRMAV